MSQSAVTEEAGTFEHLWSSLWVSTTLSILLYFPCGEQIVSKLIVVLECVSAIYLKANIVLSASNWLYAE